MVAWEDVLATIEEILSGRGIEGFSTRELAEVLGVGQKRARELVRDLVDAGKMECAGFRRERTMDGRPCARVPVYRLKKEGT